MYIHIEPRIPRESKQKSSPGIPPNGRSLRHPLGIPKRVYLYGSRGIPKMELTTKGPTLDSKKR
jgi:hypothetical protein